MQASQLPVKFTLVFGQNAQGTYIRVVPNITGDPNAASFNIGFPPNTFVPLSAGGEAPNGRDFNGLLNAITAWNQWEAAGGSVPYDSVFQAAIGGYPKGAVVASAATFGLFWLCTVDNNVTNPDTGGAGWISFLPMALQLAGGQCQLQYVGNTSIILMPKNGNNVIVGGSQIQIPAAGVTVANTNVTINGVANQNLGANASYLVALNQAGGLEFWTAITGHAPSTTAGNIGIEIISGQNLKSLVGAIITDSNNKFQFNNGQLNVATWFNRSMNGGVESGGTAVNVTALQELNAALRISFWLWADEAVEISSRGWIANSVIDAQCFLEVAVDSNTYNSGGNLNMVFGSGDGYNNSIFDNYLFKAGTIPEGAHTASPYCSAPNGVGHFVNINNIVKTMM